MKNITWNAKMSHISGFNKAFGLALEPSNSVAVLVLCLTSRLAQPQAVLVITLSAFHILDGPRGIGLVGHASLTTKFVPSLTAYASALRIGHVILIIEGKAICCFPIILFPEPQTFHM